MKNQSLFKAHIDEEGRLIIPSEIVSRFGLKPDADVYIEEVMMNPFASAHISPGKGLY